MAAYVKFYIATEDTAKGKHNFGSDTLKFTLSNTGPSQSNALLSDITQISNGNGFTTGGSTTAQQSCAQSTGTLKLVVTDTVFTASGGTIGAFRYVVFYNSTPTSPLKPLISYWDYGSSITLASGETFTVDADDTNGVFTIA